MTAGVIGEAPALKKLILSAMCLTGGYSMKRDSGMGRKPRRTTFVK
jgi:hypothetical protein